VDSELSNEGQGNDYLGLIADEVAKIKAILVDRISRVESCVKEGGVSAAMGSQQVQEIQEMEERVEAERADLQAQLREKEEILHATGSDFEGLEENLSAKIHDLESQVREKEELLDLRDDELKVVKSKMDLLTNLVTRMEFVVKRAEAGAAGEAEQGKGTLWAEAAALKAQLREKEEILHATGSDFEGLQENLSAKIHDLESQAREKEELLDLRDAELKDLKSKMRTLNFSPASTITPTEEDPVTPKEAEEEQGETARRSEVEQGGSRFLKESMAAEMQRLKAEIREKDVFLGAREMEVKMIKQSMEERVGELERIVKRQALEGQEKSRFVSFVPPIDRKN